MIVPLVCPHQLIQTWQKLSEDVSISIAIRLLSQTSCILTKQLPEVCGLRGSLSLRTNANVLPTVTSGPGFLSEECLQGVNHLEHHALSLQATKAFWFP